MNAEALGGTAGVRQDGWSHGKYRILAQLGEGGMGCVYLAVSHGPSGFNKLVVLKTLKRGFSDDPEVRKMFLREARVAARLNHPGIVQTYEVFESGGSPLIVMEYLEGQTLASVRRRAKADFPLLSHLRIIADATGALHHAHELIDFDGKPIGLVHRDMTPQNVFVTFDGHVKLLDFGIAKLTTSIQETQRGTVKGKLRYMPPEQIAGETIDRRADIYAVGVMLWEAATGTQMWKGCSDVTVMNKVLNGEMVHPSSIEPQVPERLEAICMKALSFARDARYGTAAELEADVDNLLDELGPRANGRVIGAFASRLFADVREETKAVIEAQLSKVAPLGSGESPPAVYETLRPEMVQPVGDGPPGFGALAGGAASGFVASRERARTGKLGRSRRVLMAAGVLAVVLVLIGVGVALRGQMAPAPAINASLAPTSSPSEAPRPPPEARVSIRILASPSDAKLFLDGELLPTNPFVRTLVADGSQHIVTAEARGYESRSAAFSTERDSELVVDLERKPAVDKPVSTVSPNAAAVKRPVPTPPPAANCNPPYRVDSSGIKTFKLQCL